MSWISVTDAAFCAGVSPSFPEPACSMLMQYEFGFASGLASTSFAVGLSTRPCAHAVSSSLTYISVLPVSSIP
jgi:hypothetical protein